MKNTRIYWIDIAKGLGIIFVILGHITYNSDLAKELYTFHMPLFFFLSGYVFEVEKYDNNINFITHKVKTLLLPYFSLCIITIVYLNYMYPGNFTKYLQILIQTNVTTTLWFLPCLFFSELVFFYLIKILRNDLYRIGKIVLLLTILGLLYYRFIDVSLLFKLDTCLIAIFFIFLGYLLKKIKFMSSNKYRYKKFFIICICINILTGFIPYKMFNLGLNMNRHYYGIEPLCFLAAISGIFIVIIVSSKIYSNIIQYIGKNSLIFFSLHQAVFLDLLKHIFKQINIFQDIENPSLLQNPVYVLVNLLLVLFFCYIINYIIYNTRLRIIIGK